MLSNYFRLSLRNAIKNASLTLINLLGLSVGLASCLLIVLFVHNEWSFDGFHTQSEQLYRLNEVQTWEGIIPQNVALSMYPMGPTLQQDYPEVENFARIINRTEVPFEAQGKKIFLDQIYLTDTSFLSLFDFPFLHGSPQGVLNEPNSTVISEETALKLFGISDVIGQQVRFIGNDTTVLKVTGVLENVPKNSHLQFDALLSLPTFPEADSNWMNNWGSNWLVTYLKLQSGTDLAALEKKFPDYLVKYMGEDAPEGYQLFLQPLNEVHLGSSNITHDYQNYRKFNEKYVQIFAYMALFVLLIAGINFMNLSTAQSTKRALEVGIRKTIGATRAILARFFLFESLLFTLVAFLIALGITALALPFLNDFAQREMSFFTLFQPTIIFPLLLVCLLIGLLSGLYPRMGDVWF